MQSALCVALGAIAKHFPLAVTDHTELKNKMLAHLIYETSKQKSDMQIVRGCLNGFSNYMTSFDVTDGKEALRHLYKAVKILADSQDAARLATNRGKG